jgi:acyl transferase domain-containing protein
VAAGPEAAIATLQRRAEEWDRPARRLNVSHAFHCALMDPILDAFHKTVAGMSLAEPTIPFVSNLTGRWIEAAEATDPGYWVRHLRGTVRFADNLATLKAEPGRLLVEVGPGAILSRLARANGVAEADTVTTLPEVTAGRSALQAAIARLWVRGVEPDWDAMAGGRRRYRVSMPGYPFQRVRTWIDPYPTTARETAPATQPPAIEPRSEPEDRTATTDTVLAVWREVFGISEIGEDTDFFALGGDSMVALRIVSRLYERLGWTVSVAAVLSGRTPGGFVREHCNLQSPDSIGQRETGIL